MEAPFKDLRVIELASVLAGPAVGMFLAELGAEVIKVEHFKGGGDITRGWKLPAETSETDVSAYFSAVNWGKASIGVDLRDPAGREVIYDLVRTADIVVASYKPGDAQKLGMDAGTLMARNPALIYADITAYGPEDPRVGFDAIIQAEAGFTYMNGQPDSPPTKMPVALMDLLAGHQLKEGILLALIHRMKTGKGQHVQTSLIEAGISALANQATNWLVGETVPQRMGSDHPNIVPYGTIYETADGGGIVLAVGTEAQFARLCEILGVPELVAEFPDNAARVRARASFHTRLGAAIAKMPQAELLTALAAAKVPAGAVRDMRTVFESAAAQELLFRDGDMRGLRSVALPGLPRLPLQAPPRLAADTTRVLREVLGYGDEKIATLRKMNAVAGE